MKYYIGPEGKADFLRTAGDLPVIIDVLRASSTIIVALACGAARVVPVIDREQALAVGKELGALTIGERNGIKIEGFDCGNSPTEMLKTPVKGRTIVITTTNGTRIMVEGGVIASTLNAEAVAEKVRSTPHAFLLASGAPLKSEEDLCAAKLIELIAGSTAGGSPEDAAKSAARTPEALALIDRIRHSRSGEKLSAYGASRDVELICSAINEYPVLPVYSKGVIALPDS